jgi:hypothetical protein
MSLRFPVVLGLWRMGKKRAQKKKTFKVEASYKLRESM